MSVDARAEVLERLRQYAHHPERSRRQASFVQPARVAAALALAREGRVTCWTETWPGGGEVLVCELPGEADRAGGGRAA